MEGIGVGGCRLLAGVIAAIDSSEGIVVHGLAWLCVVSVRTSQTRDPSPLKV